MNGNTGHASDQLKVDTTAPAVSVTGVANGHQYVLGAVPAPGCATTDSLSGVGTAASAHVSSGGSHGVGRFTAQCTGATDVAGNPQAAPAVVSYTVVDGFGGFFSPKPGTTLAKSASTIVITFRLVEAGGQPIPAAAASALGAVAASLGSAMLFRPAKRRIQGAGTWPAIRRFVLAVVGTAVLAAAVGKQLAVAAAG
ncbi:MAG TPA: hypothetical protein VMU94_32010 [Streptosporangiaceae bacterium]|nr:hypothetical protein [Streptosporangiaceae bacterium]